MRDDELPSAERRRLLERRTAGLEDLAEALREVRSVLGSREIKVSL